MLNRNIFLLSFLVCTVFSHAQTQSSSPFSSSGIGETGGVFNGAYAASGGVTSVMVDTLLLNFYNPATYANLSTGQPLFSTAVGASLSRSDVNGASTSGAFAGIDHFAFAFPIKKRFGFAFGLNSFSRRGYATSEYQYFLTDTIEHRYFGSGSTQRLFTGFSANILNGPTLKWGVGGNFGYVFGNVSNWRTASFLSADGAGGADQTSIGLKSFHHEYGTFIQKSFERKLNQKLTLGATYVPTQTMNAYKDYRLYYSTDVTDFRSYDTVSMTENVKGTIVYPSSVKLGFAYAIQPLAGNDKKRNIYRLNIYGEYSSSKWSDYRETFDGVTTSTNYSDQTRVSAGLDFTPSIPGTSKSVKKFNPSSFIYRAGFYDQTLNYTANGSAAKEQAVSVGVQIPFSQFRSNSSFTLSVVGGKRTFSEMNYNQQFLNISFGIIIAPMPYDRWFRRYKLD